MAAQLGVQAAVSVRQLRRWEAPYPPLPHPGQQQVLEALLGVPLEELGFAVPVERRSAHQVGGHHGGVERRRFVVDVGAVLGAAALPATRPGRRIGAVDVVLLRSEVAGLYAVDHSAGGRAARTAARRVLTSLERALTGGSYLERICRDLHALVGTVHSHLGWMEFDAGRPGRARTACSEALATAGRPQVLIVDDQPANLIALEAVLAGADCQVLPVASGTEALKALLQHDDIAVIILDVQMPGMDGYETAAHIKRRTQSRSIPIIFVTAIGDDPENLLRGYDAGAIDYIVKPFEPWMLCAKVAVLTGMYLDHRSTPCTTPPTPPPGDTTGWLLPQRADRSLHQAGDAGEAGRG